MLNVATENSTSKKDLAKNSMATYDQPVIYKQATGLAMDLMP
jgi:hypothetical protein